MSRGAGSSSRGGGGAGGAGGSGSDGRSDGFGRASLLTLGAGVGFAAFAVFAAFAGFLAAGLAGALAGAFPLCDLPFVFATRAP